jgi:hypothetical protein
MNLLTTSSILILKASGEVEPITSFTLLSKASEFFGFTIMMF